MNFVTYILAIAIVVFVLYCLYCYALRVILRRYELEASQTIVEYDNAEEDLDEIMIPESFESLLVDSRGDVETPLAAPSVPDSTTGPPRRLTKRRRVRPQVGKIACSLAKAAYLQFGDRIRSAANLLITRKWMRDRLSEYADLRAHDAGNIIDAALELSFYPSKAAQCMALHRLTQAHADRMSALPTYGGWWAALFGGRPGRPH